MTVRSLSLSGSMSRGPSPSTRVLSGAAMFCSNDNGSDVQVQIVGRQIENSPTTWRKIHPVRQTEHVIYYYETTVFITHTTLSCGG